MQTISYRSIDVNTQIFYLLKTFLFIDNYKLGLRFAISIDYF
jgi:hypothetical protein